MARKWNFYAGPSIVPVDVLETIRDEIVEYKDTGLSLVETSHRSPAYDAVHQQALALFRELYSIPENYSVLFLGGGATMQFGMIPMNFLGTGKTCDFTLTGAWSQKAYEDAVKLGDVRIVFDGKEKNYMTLPETLDINPDAAYCYITSNETIGGVQWKSFPETGDVPLFADMSSDILSRKIDVSRFGLIFAGAQKNLGPAGVTVVIVKNELLENVNGNLPAYLDYNTHAAKDSLYNTPPVFSIYAMMLVLDRMKRKGGLDYFEKANQEKADLLYSTIDNSGGFYSCPVDKAYRSNMNVVFTTPDADLDKAFIQEAAALGFAGLKGHRSVGGCRASIYNAMEIDGVKALTDFMQDYAKRKG